MKLKDAEGHRASRRRADIGVTIAFFVIAVVAGIASFVLHGGRAVGDSLADAGLQLVVVVPHLALGLLIAAAVTVLVPREKVAGWLGRDSGTRGIVLATVLGAVMPGGPFASFPLVFALAQAGADMGSLIAFLVAWASIGLNRLLIWELPFMGLEFSTIRFVSSLPLPIIAGLLARQLCRRYPQLGE